MRKFGLIGYPLSHSFSQKYFTEKFKKENITDCTYQNFSIPGIADIIQVLHTEPELCGLNVTIPYKEQVIPYLYGKNEIVEKIGACNCIKILKGKLYGYNTDALGFEISLKKDLKDHHDQALILGTGGAAKAVAYVLKKLHISYRFVSRNPVQPDALSYEALTPELVTAHRLIINTTPLGMYPDLARCPELPYQGIHNRHYLFDLIYNPEKTAFLRKGEEQGAAIRNGYEMLVLQAEESWRIWNEQGMPGIR